MVCTVHSGPAKHSKHMRATEVYQYSLRQASSNMCDVQLLLSQFRYLASDYDISLQGRLGTRLNLQLCNLAITMVVCIYSIIATATLQLPCPVSTVSATVS